MPADWQKQLIIPLHKIDSYRVVITIESHCLTQCSRKGHLQGPSEQAEGKSQQDAQREPVWLSERTRLC